MANINIRIDDKMKIALKKEAGVLDISLSDLVRERLTGKMKSEMLNKGGEYLVTLGEVPTLVNGTACSACSASLTYPYGG